MKSCHSCIHWQKVDTSKILWDFEPPADEDCDIPDIEYQWPNPQATINAYYRGGSEARLQEIAAQCPSFTDANQERSPSIKSSSS